MITCSHCGAEYQDMPRVPRCTRCCHWRTLGEHGLRSVGSDDQVRSLTLGDHNDDDDEGDGHEPAGLVSLANVFAEDTDHLATHIKKIDRLFNGGFVSGTVIVLGGGPGSGKTTFVLQMIEALGAVAYFVSGEMQPRRLKNAAKRLKVATSRIHVMATRDIDEACAVDPTSLVSGRNSDRPLVVIFDAIHVFSSQNVRGAPGSTTQLPHVMEKILAWTQEHDAICFAIARYNADGEISGPNGTQHEGDVTVLIETPEGLTDKRRLIKVIKNRDGAAGEAEVAMGKEGLILT